MLDVNGVRVKHVHMRDNERRRRRYEECLTSGWGILCSSIQLGVRLHQLEEVVLDVDPG